MEKLKTYIENARSKGYSDDQIRASLLKAGWQPARIDAALPPASAPASDPDDSRAMPVQRPGDVKPLQQTDQADDVDLANLNIDSDKPATPAKDGSAKTSKSADPEQPLLKRLLPKAGFGLVVLIGLVITVNGLKAYNHTHVPGGFVTTRGTIAFSIPGKKGQYDTRVNFKTPNGGNHGFVTPTPPGDNNNSRYVAGDGMKVAYYPQNPDMTALDLTDRGSPANGMIFMGAGAVITLIGAFFLQRQLRRR